MKRRSSIKDVLIFVHMQTEPPHSCDSGTQLLFYITLLRLCRAMIGLKSRWEKTSVCIFPLLAKTIWPSFHVQLEWNEIDVLRFRCNGGLISYVTKCVPDDFCHVCKSLVNCSVCQRWSSISIFGTLSIMWLGLRSEQIRRVFELYSFF